MPDTDPVQALGQSAQPEVTPQVTDPVVAVPPFEAQPAVSSAQVSTTPDPSVGGMISPSPADTANYYQSSGPNRSQLWLVGGLVAFVFLLVGGLWLAWQKDWLPTASFGSSQNQPTQIQPAEELITASPTPATVTVDISQLVYKKNDELWRQKADGQEEQLTQTGGGVLSYAQAFPKPLVAYIHGQRVVTQSNYFYISPLQVSILNVENGQSTPIFSLTPTTLEGINTEFIDQIKDVNFSDDGQLLAITTSQSLQLYDVVSQKLTEVFNIPYQGGLKATGTFSYRVPRFSPDKTKLVLIKQYYEGYGTAVVDLTSGEVVDLPYRAGHGYNQVILGWTKASSLIVFDGRETESGGQDYPNLIEVSYPGLQTKVLSQHFPGGTQFEYADDETIYILSEGYDQASQQFLFTITKFNLNTGATTTQLIDTSVSEGYEQRITNLLGIADGQLLFTVATIPLTPSSTNRIIESIEAINLMSE